jgi:putative nucleotidyltransferase with HDIG domain
LTSDRLQHPPPTLAPAHEPRWLRALETRGVAAAEPDLHTQRDADPATMVAVALEAALRVRVPGVHASTPLVRQLAARVSRELGLDGQTQALLDIAARLRDVGMLGLPDSVVLATTLQAPAEWELLNRHPVIGAQLLEELPEVAPAAPIVRAHHERWDGGGYPEGQSGETIPLLSRLIAVCDALAATATDRPHRRGLGVEAALQLLHQESGAQFDPTMADALAAAVSVNRRLRSKGKVGASPFRSRAPVRQTDDGQLHLTDAAAEFDVVPVLAPAYERVIAATASEATPAGEIVKDIESDTGLTVAVLRRAQTVRSRRPITNVADAVVALGPALIAKTIETLPRTAFPWRTSPLEVLMHRSLVHAQAVARATDRIAHELELTRRDDLLVAALLHDVGKLVLGRALPDYTGVNDQTTTPEARVRQEGRAWGMDHASLGGALILRWGLPNRLAQTVAAHHTAENEKDLATHVRLADMVAHHAQGDAVDRRKMLELAHLCGVSARSLREILFDLPHAGGSDRRRAEPSPLSPRETAALKGLAEGKVYKAIAAEQGTSVSTVRSHLHNVYGKLDVVDRAQAVLRATELGWI